MMGDGGFWHNGLTSGIANAVFNRSDNLTIVVDNNYTSATGGQDLLSSKAAHPTRSTGHAIEKAVRGVGVDWVRTIRRTYDVAAHARRPARGADQQGERPEGADRPVGVPAQPAAPDQAAGEGGGGRAASGSCASASASMPTPAPATTPASASRAARRCRSSRTPIRCAPTRSRPCSTAASAAASAARSRMRPCSARPSTRRASSAIRAAGTGSPSGCAARVIGWLQRRDARARARLAF